MKEFGFKCGAVEHLLKMDLNPEFVADANMLWYIERQMLPEPEVLHLLVRALKPGHTAIDGGANIGFFSLVMSRLVGSTGRVIAIEPCARNLIKLRRNLDLNDIKNVKIVEHPLAAANTETVAMYFHDDSGSNSILPQNETDVHVPMKAVALDDYESDCAVLIKLDIEGSEWEAIRGAQQLLKRQPPRYIVIEYNYEMEARLSTSFKDLRAHLCAHGYECFALQPTGNFPIHIPLETDIKSDRWNVNLLFSASEDVTALWPEIFL